MQDEDTGRTFLFQAAAPGVNPLFPGNNKGQGGRIMSLLRKKRIFYILLLFTVVLGVFALRMAWIQAASAFRAATVGGKTINELAVRQREESIELDPGTAAFTALLAQSGRFGSTCRGS